MKGKYTFHKPGLRSTTFDWRIVFVVRDPNIDKFLNQPHDWTRHRV
jgi:hypothetical protein